MLKITVLLCVIIAITCGLAGANLVGIGVKTQAPAAIAAGFPYLLTALGAVGLMSVILPRIRGRS